MTYKKAIVMATNIVGILPLLALLFVHDVIEFVIVFLLTTRDKLYYWAYEKDKT